MRQTGWICPISQDMAGGICWRDTEAELSHVPFPRGQISLSHPGEIHLLSLLLAGGGRGWSGSNSLRAAGGLGTRGVKGPLFSLNAH